MKGSIIGEPVDRYVIDQVKTRQKIYGKGIDGASARTPQELQYMNNRNAWIKMASSVYVKDTNYRLPKGIENVDSFSGDNLAKKAILFNGLSSLGEPQRSGISLNSSNYNNSAYGLGGTQFGIQPMPGINSLQVNTKNRGSIKTATVELIAFNRFQFELIETLYLRLGFCMLVEWGWDKYIGKDGKFHPVKSTVLENGFFNITNQDQVLRSINSIKEKYEGNYGGFFGRVANFNWNFQNDGSYKISIKLTGLGDIIESLKVNQSPSKELKQSLEGLTHQRYKLLEESDSAIFNQRASTKLGAILYKKLNLQSIWESGEDTNKNYYNLYLSLLNSEYTQIIGNKGTNAIDLKYAYFIRFGELCNILQQNIVPDVNDNIKHIKFDGSTDNVICSYQPNLISFDPKVCIIKMDGDFTPINHGSIGGICIPDYTKKLLPFASKITGNGNNENKYIITYEPNIKSFTNYFLPTPLKEVESYGPFNIFTSTYSPSPGTNASLPDNGTFIKETKAPNNIKDGDLLYGKIYNIYLNYDMIFKSLKNNVDKKGNLSFFKFLQSICDQVNSAFANSIDIEPIIKEDKTITFLDQKPVVGLSKNLPSFGIDQTDTVEIEVYGFNKSTLEGTFLKDISFNTKISSKIANQISIGATANGVAAGEDSTGYSNWNRGLVDRFQQTIKDPEEKTDPKPPVNDPQPETTGGGYEGDNDDLGQIAGDQKSTRFPKTVIVDVPLTRDYYITKEGVVNYRAEVEKRKIKFEIDKDGNVIDGLFIYGYTIENNKPYYLSYPLKDYEGIDSSRAYIITQNLEKFKNAFLKAFAEGYGVTLQDVALESVGNGIFSKVTYKLTQESLNSVKESEKKKTKKLAGLNYSSYLANMFGGIPSVSDEEETEAGIKSKSVNKVDSKYPFREGEGDFSSSGKSSYKIYLNEESKKNYDDGEEGSTSPSNQIGLIPVEFDMQMDGISGFKIYNKININQRFLPSNYGESLDFLIKGVNHKIDSSGWSTNLQTLSTSNLNTTPVRQNKPTVEIPPPPTTTGNNNVNTPNADRLRAAIQTANFIEKGSELSNGGDITSNAADLGISLIRVIKEKLPEITLRFTGGNDEYHQNLSYNSRHKRGNALDFTIIPFNVSNKEQVLNIIEGFAAGNNPKVRFKDEYKQLTAAATGAHFHISWGEGTEGKEELAQALKKAQAGAIETYTV